jgi:hypothetical protein
MLGRMTNTNERGAEGDTRSNTARTIASALATLRAAVAGLRFATLTDEATWIALVLTVMARELAFFEGPAPLFLIGGVPGVGKSTLAKITGLITIGAVPLIVDPTRDEHQETWLIGHAASGGVPLVCVESVGGRWGSQTMCSMLTADHWAGRPYGAPASFCWPLRTTWVATTDGEAESLSVDMQRRVARIHLKETEPSDVMRFAREHRDDLRAAAIMLLCHGGDSRVPFPLEPWGSYDRWTGVVRRALSAAGLPDVLTPRASKPPTIPTDVASFVAARAAEMAVSPEWVLRALWFVLVDAERGDKSALVTALERARRYWSRVDEDR